MSTQSVTVYVLPTQGAFLHGNAVTDMGVWLASPPFLHVPFDQMRAELWPKVLEVLSQPSKKVPHPSRFDQLDTLYAMASCKSWKQFAKNAIYCMVIRIFDEIQIVPGKWDGKMFTHSREYARRFKIDDPMANRALLEFLEE